MKILSWNARGVGRPHFVAQVRTLVSIYKPDFIFIMETKANNDKINKIAKKIGFDNHFVVPGEGLSGGLWIFWNSNTCNANVIDHCDRYIHIRVFDSIKHSFWQLTCIYGYPQHAKQTYLWDKIYSIANKVGEPWAVISDFNEILSVHEKKGGNAGNSSRINDFMEFIDRCNLIDIGHIGLPYTWYNKREGIDAIFERLDRVLVNLDWLNDYPNAWVDNLPIMGSDHGPILLVTDKETNKGRKPFKFETVWMDSPKMENIVRDAWSSNVQGSNSFRLARKISKFCSLACDWNKNNFGNFN
ncbi:hypothetical protein L1049_012595 [Liquidambar formosana]|uniref:Endonuclease/exonuclease/phosphatase domain-containing protein n=1 Tax=Liquidambar formosana TaxID=63359 RepID=A0AAP0R1L3_LIQFO